MAIVDFDTTTWKDPWFRQLNANQKTLFVFLWTNDHKNLACLYEMDLDTMSFYTALTVKQLKKLLPTLFPKVKYDYESSVVWVVSFVRRQFMRTPNISPKIIAGIEKSLIEMDGHFLIGEFLEEYGVLNFSYPYPIDTVSEGYLYPSSGGEGEGGGGGEGKKKEDKVRHGEFVLLTDKQYQTLIDKHGKPFANRMIQILDNAIGSKGYKYRSHYHVMKEGEWVHKRAKEDMASQPRPELTKDLCEKCRRFPRVGQFDDGKDYCERCWPNKKKALETVGEALKGIGKGL
jgi:hypothetical protein